MFIEYSTIQKDFRIKFLKSFSYIKSYKLNINMTREEAKQTALQMIDAEIAIHGEEGIFMRAPKIGKNSWTNKEARESILEDKPLEDSGEYNLIDSVLAYYRYMENKS